MEADEVLQKAWEAVEKSGVPESLHEVAFQKAVDIVTAKAGLAVAAAPATDSAGPTPPLVLPADGTDLTLAKVAAKLGVSTTSVEDIFHIENDAPVLSLGTSKLGASNSQAVKEIALLIAAVRQGGGWDADWTATSEIRAFADHYSKFDGNFAAHVTSLEDEFTFSGNGASRRVKLRKQGWERATTLVKQLAGEE